MALFLYISLPYKKEEAELEDRRKIKYTNISECHLRRQ